LQYESEPGDSGEEYSPGGIILGGGIGTNDGIILAWISPGEDFYTPGDLYRMWESYVQERDEGEVP
jgi:hypothetical protein